MTKNIFAIATACGLFGFGCVRQESRGQAPERDASVDVVVDVVPDVAPDVVADVIGDVVPDVTPDAGEEPDVEDAGGDDADAGPMVACRDALDCNDANLCTEDRCEVVGGENRCVHVAALCADDVRCTVDACDPATGACSSVPNDARCEPGRFCSAADDCVGCLTDGNCADRFACNGAERCLGGTCAPGTPVACARDERCDEPGGVCVSVEVSFEICDGVDNDGDGVVDEVGGICDAVCRGRHAPGVQVCVDGRDGPCAGVEVCNGCDDDADGIVDNGSDCGLGSSEPCDTACGSLGSRVCSDLCRWESCTPPAESCNGLDDDCSGAPDDAAAFDCVEGSSRPCDTACGSVGTEECVGCRWTGECIPPVEVCDGESNDCLGEPDHGFACALGATRFCPTECGGLGFMTCAADCSWGRCVAAIPEICGNGLDDDCDGRIDLPCLPPGGSEVCNGVDDDRDDQVDEGYPCVLGSSSSCVTGCGSRGVAFCGTGCVLGACIPPAEVCDGADNDCNAGADNGFACAARSSGSCMTPCGSTGSRVCSDACEWGSCQAPVESCNRIDDDCDGSPDNGFECVQGNSQSCVTGCGSTGSRACNASCAWGACVAPVEVCDSVDQDCVNGPDNGFACVRGAVRACTTACGTVGSQTCAADCSAFSLCRAATETCGNGCDDDGDGAVDEGCPPPCVPTVEVCDGRDNDCDGAVDEGLPNLTCGVGACFRTVPSCVGGVPQSCTPGAPSPEVCDAVDNDCDGAVDEGLPQLTCGTGACQRTIPSCVGGVPQSCTPGSPSPEVCDAVDNDCDGAVDEGFAPLTCGTGACQRTIPACVLGVPQSCTPGAPSPEVCGNAVDEDCDGVQNNGCPPPPPPRCMPDVQVVRRPQYQDNGDPAALGPEWQMISACADLNGDGDVADPGECGTCSAVIDPLGGSVALQKLAASPPAYWACQLAQVLPASNFRFGDSYEVCVTYQLAGPLGVPVNLEGLDHDGPFPADGSNGVFWTSFTPSDRNRDTYCATVVAHRPEAPGPNNDIRITVHYGGLDPANTLTVYSYTVTHLICM